MLLLTIFASFLVVMMAEATDRKHNSNGGHTRRFLTRGEPMLQGNFVWHLYRKGTVAPPSDNVTITYNRKSKDYTWKDQAGGECTLETINDLHDTLKVSEDCPYYNMDSFHEVKVNRTALVGPGGKVYERRFGNSRLSPLCSNKAFTLLYCQEEDMKRVMLENARLYWNHDVWFNYRQFLHQLVCICNIKARYSGFDHFTISFFGQCQGVDVVNRKPLTPSGCMNGEYGNCTMGVDEECSGKAHRDAVYRVEYSKRDYHSDERMRTRQRNRIPQRRQDWQSQNKDFRDNPRQRKYGRDIIW